MNPVTSKFLDKKWRKHIDSLHKQRLERAKSVLKVSEPAVPEFIRTNKKKLDATQCINSLKMSQNYR
jgi:hypothetical protein